MAAAAPILGIDLGHHLGWFMGAAVGPCRFGTIKLADTTDLGAFLRSADTPLRDLLPLARAVAVEKPDTAGNSYFPIRKNFALLGHLAYWAAWHGVPIIAEVSVSTAKLTLAGHGHAQKPAMIAAARAAGYAVEDEHQADACAIWMVATFGARERNKPKSRSSKGVSVMGGGAHG